MQLHNVKREHTNKGKKRIGRGGLRGKTSGRGHKGQKAHAGHAPRPEMRDIIKRLPKRRGYGKNRARTVNASVIKPAVINISTLDRLYLDGERVTPRSLVAKRVVSRLRGRIPAVKVLGRGELSKKLVLSGFLISASAREEIEKKGGVVE